MATHRGLRQLEGRTQLTHGQLVALQDEEQPRADRLEAALTGFLAQHPDAGRLTGEAIAADPGMIAARGWRIAWRWIIRGRWGAWRCSTSPPRLRCTSRPTKPSRVTTGIGFSCPPGILDLKIFELDL